MSTITTELLDRSFTVEALMTPYNELFMCNFNEDFATVREKATRQGFDCVPIVHDGKVISILPKGSIRPEPLVGKWLVSRDTPVFHLLNLFVRNELQPFLVLHRQDIVGIVTPADLNKMPMRVYVYNVIGELEMLLAALLREHFGDNQKAILELISTDHASKVACWQERAAQKNVEADIITYVFFDDLLDVIRQTKDLRLRLSLEVQDFTDHGPLDGLHKLRNRTMHTVGPLVLEYRGEDGLVQVQERLEFALDMIERLTDLLADLKVP